MANGAKKVAKPYDDTSAAMADALLHIATQGFTFATEQGRLSHLDQRIGAREALSHRIIGESGGGQARAQLPGGAGGVPTVTKGPGG